MKPAWYQLAKLLVEPAARAGYSAIALDNYGLRNTWAACGSYSGPNGTWRQMYDARDPKHERGVVGRTERANPTN